MKYALTIQPGDDFDSVNTLIIEDGLAPGEAGETKTWLDGGQPLIDIIMACGYGVESARQVVKDHKYFIINCEDTDYNQYLIDDIKRLKGGK